MQKVLVTGAGGSIGTELVRALLEDGQYVVALDLCEYNLWRLGQTVGEKNVEFLLGDVRDDYMMDAVVREHDLATIYHAAALKQVPILEHPHNALEAIRTNVLGTWNTLAAARDHRVKFVLVSTDKAVQPISVMGATKTFAELLTLGYSGRNLIVRFGNVVGSAGSVFPLWQQQMSQGKPLTLTDARMNRYMMSIAEAVSLVVQAGRLDSGRYILDMGPARNMLSEVNQFRCLMGDQDYPVVEIGIRAGEKLDELLFDPDKERLVGQKGKLIRVEDTQDRGAEYANALLNQSVLSELSNRRETKAAIEVVKTTTGYRGDVFHCDSL